MKSIEDAYKAYLVTDGFLSHEEATARSAATRQRWAQKRLHNDQAYYVFIFAQLEGYINDHCEKLVLKKSGSSNWKRRRLWDTVDLDRLDFRRRLALLTDKDGSAYQKVLEYYGYRNDIAHGERYTAMPVAVPVVAADLIAIAKTLRG